MHFELSWTDTAVLIFGVLAFLTTGYVVLVIRAERENSKEYLNKIIEETKKGGGIK